jgi:FtsH-binding integral membrane protein
LTPTNFNKIEGLEQDALRPRARAPAIRLKIVNIFMQSDALTFAISLIGVVVFAGLTAYDTQQIKEMYFEGDDSDTASKKAILGALRLYMDFINLFLMLLRLFANRE